MAEPVPNDATSVSPRQASRRRSARPPEPSQPMQLRLAAGVRAWRRGELHRVLRAVDRARNTRRTSHGRGVRLGRFSTGQNPYRVIRPTGPYPFNAGFFYPLPAGIAALPFALFRPAVAGAAFVGVSSGLLAFGLARTRGGCEASALRQRTFLHGGPARRSGRH